jgi:hypothetical protein
MKYAITLLALCACGTVGPPPRKMQMLVVPLTLETSYVVRSECMRSNNGNIAVDYGASDVPPGHTASAYKNLRYYECPEATVLRLGQR